MFYTKQVSYQTKKIRKQKFIIYSVNLRIQSESRKIGTRKTSNTGTFCAVDSNNNFTWSLENGIHKFSQDNYEILEVILFQNILTLYFPMFPFGPPENIKKPLFFWCFQRDQKLTLGRKWLTECLIVPSINTASLFVGKNKTFLISTWNF